LSLEPPEALAKYPFLPEAREYLSAYGFTLDQLTDPAYRPILERAVARVVRAIEGGEAAEPWEVEDRVAELASFPLAVILVASAGDRFLARRFALAEAVVAQRLLQAEDDDFVLDVARRVFGIDVRREERVVGGVQYRFSMGLADYLRSASKFNDPSWKLVNRVVDAGRVMLEARELVRLLRDRVEERVMRLVEEAGRERLKLPQQLLQEVERIKAMIPRRSVEEASIKATAKPEAWPPCMKEIYRRLTSGESVSHFANFAIASFLLNAGVKPEEVVSIYSQRSDFNERIARYQVEHIAGMRGSRTRYTPPSCEKMRTNGLCIEDGRLCGPVKNPLQYYRRRLRGLGRRAGSEGQGGEGRD